MSRRIVVKTHLCSPGKFSRSYTAREWYAQPGAGSGWMPDGLGGYLSIRNCRCGSTLAIEVTEEEALRRGMPEPTNDCQEVT